VCTYIYIYIYTHTHIYTHTYRKKKGEKKKYARTRREYTSGSLMKRESLLPTPPHSSPLLREARRSASRDDERCAALIPRDRPTSEVDDRR